MVKEVEFTIFYLLLLSLRIDTRLSYTATNKLLDRNVDVDGSYRCKANEDIKFNSSATEYKVNVTLEVVDLQVQAYFNGYKEEFDTRKLIIIPQLISKVTSDWSNQLKLVTL